MCYKYFLLIFYIMILIIISFYLIYIYFLNIYYLFVMENGALKLNSKEIENLTHIFDFLEQNVTKKKEVKGKKQNIPEFSLLNKNKTIFILPKVNYKNSQNFLKIKVQKTFSAKKDFLVKL